MSKLPLLSSIMAAWLAGACQAPSQEAPLASSSAATPSGGATGAPASASASQPHTAVDREQAEARARALLERWLTAQNDRKLDDYAQLYAPDFSGIRRTPSGEEKKLGTKEWLDDRGKLFARAQRVAADEVVSNTWHAGALPAGEIELSFVQRWKSETSADHGPKTLRLRVSTDGNLLIIAEELKSSAQGWSGKKPLEVDASALKSPVTVQGVWKTRAGAPPTVELFLLVRDAAGTSQEWVVPHTRCTSDGALPSGGLQANAAGPVLLERKHPCGPEYVDFFRVVADAQGLVVRNRTLIDLHQEGPGASQDTGWQDLLRVALARGVVARGK